MKIFSTPIGFLALFENGTPHPIRFRLNDKESRSNRQFQLKKRPKPQLNRWGFFMFKYVL